MCDQIERFCSGSAKPLVLAGAVASLVLALAIGYTGHSTNQLYHDIDNSVAETHSLSYYLQLSASLYLLLITIFSCVAVHLDHKPSIRVLAVLAAVNFVLASTAILMVPSCSEASGMFGARLTQAQALYDFSDKSQPSPIPSDAVKERQVRMVNQTNAALTATSVSPTEQASGRKFNIEPLNKTTATQIWDKLQARGCCGFANYTIEWTEMIPKSCCASPVVDGDKMKCVKVDEGHEFACKNIIESSSFNLMIVLALIALVNLYLATVSGISAYRTFHYDEASQNAYT